MNTLADTDVLIDFLKGKGEAQRVADALTNQELFTSAISAFELYSGAKSEKQIHAVEALLQAMVVFPLSMDAARRAGHIRRNLDRDGKTVPMADSLIAGICLEQKLTLLTRNKKHFERIPNLNLA
jgi:tRNA(fMet)-specific endonuclease VapC